MYTNTGQAPDGRTESSLMMISAVGLNPVQIRSAKCACCIGEILLYQLMIKADRFEQLCALIGLKCGNTHF